MENLTKLQETYDALASELEATKAKFHSRIDDLYSCDVDWSRNVQEGIEIRAKEVVIIRQHMADVMAEIEKVNINVPREVA